MIECTAILYLIWQMLLWSRRLHDRADQERRYLTRVCDMRLQENHGCRPDLTNGRCMFAVDLPEARIWKQ